MLSPSSYQSSDRSVQFKQNDSGDSVAVNKGGDKLTESVPPTGLLQQVGYAPSSGSDIIRSLETVCPSRQYVYRQVC